MSPFWIAWLLQLSSLLLIPRVAAFVPTSFVPPQQVPLQQQRSSNRISFPTRLSAEETSSEGVPQATKNTSASSSNRKDPPLVTYQPVFDFSDPSRNDTEKFERIDDVVMGGISSSTLRQLPGEPFARWSGVCRTDGGGFCGVRTLPFREKLEVNFAEGIYVKCRLDGDKDTDKRVWKVTTRTEESRGEQLYQAIFQIPSDLAEGEFATIQIPFSNLTLVRGARTVKEGNPFNVFDGIYQIGFVLSKFMIGENMTELEGFRPGFFDLHFQEIGLYTRSTLKLGEDVPEVKALSKAEASQKRSMFLKILMPISRIFFTEQSQRRKSAMKKLQKRGNSRLQAILWGIKYRAQTRGIIRAWIGACQIIAADAVRLVLRSILQYGIVFPLRCLNQAVARLRKLVKSPSKAKESKSS